MRKVARFTPSILLLIHPLASGVTIAAPAPPFEAYLLRAETVFIGRVTGRTGSEVSFEVVELLRGRAHRAAGVRRYAVDKEGHVSQEGPTWLVLSQGDGRAGRPRRRVSLGPQLDGQASYRGWAAFPIRGDGETAYIDHAYTFVGREAGKPLSKLTLLMAQLLINQFPYKPELHRTVPNNGLRPTRASLDVICKVGCFAPSVRAGNAGHLIASGA